MLAQHEHCMIGVDVLCLLPILASHYGTALIFEEKHDLMLGDRLRRWTNIKTTLD